MLRTLYIKNWLVGSLLFMLGICLHTSCSDEEVGGGSVSGQEGMTLSLSVSNPKIVNPMSRAADPLSNTINDINIVITPKDGEDIDRVYYFDQSNSSDGSGEKLIEVYNLGQEKPYIHFGKEVAPNSDDIYVVANYKEKINVTTVQELKELKQHTFRNGTGGEETGLPIGTVLFGKAEVDTENTDHTDGGRTMKVELERTVAMVTVVVDGSGLNDNVSISIQEIGLCNVPKNCMIGTANNFDAYYSNVSDYFVAKGEYKMPTQPANAVVTTDKLVGTHESNDGSGKDLFSLYMFETLHNEGFGATDVNESNNNQSLKRPSRVQNQTSPSQIEAGSKDCPYVYVKGYYTYLPEGSTDKAIYGNVTFKLFLGGDIYNDFDVKRNTHYRVTLKLEKYAIAEDGRVDSNGELIPNGNDLSWRIDTEEVGSAGIVGGDVDVNGTGQYTFLEINAAGNVYWEIEGDNNAPHLWVYDLKSKQWVSIAATVSGTTVNKGVWIYAEPFVATVGGNTENYDFYLKEPFIRTINVKFRVYDYANGKKGELLSQQSMEIVQYKPVAFKLTAEEAGRLGLTPVADNAHMILLDRIGHSSMPWGFEEHELDENQSTGFYNTFHLIDRNAHEGNNPHIDKAKSYLPFGQKNNGSAMIESVQFHDPDLYNFNGRPSIGDPDDFFAQQGELPDVNEVQWGYNYYWTIPSIEEWQIIEKRIISGELIDALKDSPIQPFVKYWTSDAVVKGTQAVEGNPGSATGMTASFAYQIGRGLDSLKSPNDGGAEYPYDLRINRAASLPYRLIAVVKIP